MSHFTRANGLANGVIAEVSIGPEGAIWARSMRGISRHSGTDFQTVYEAEGEGSIDTGRTERVEHNLGRIANAANSMDRLLSELLEMSRIGRVVNPPEMVCLRELASEAAELVSADRDDEIEIEIEPSLPILPCERSRILEVFSNLIGNAVKFSRDGVKPQIRIGVRATPPTEAPVIFVEDNGIGIESQFLGRVFGLFEQLDQRKTGTGVGLAIVERIIEVHNGRLWAAHHRNPRWPHLDRI